MYVAQRQARSLTLLVLREGGRPARQLRLSKPVMVCVPIFALLSISSLIISLQIKSNQTIAGLQHRLSEQQLTLEAVVSDKNEAMRRLQGQVLNLSEQSKAIKQQISNMSSLETELEQFLGKPSSNQTERKLSSLSWASSQQLGGEFIAVHDFELERLAHETEDDFEQMQAMLDEMQKSIPLSLKQAHVKRETLSGTISTWPTPSRRMTSSFGYRSDPFSGHAAFHAGIDIGGEVGDPIFAAAAGKVTAVEKDSSRGTYIIVRHPNGLETWYMHLNGAKVAAGETVSKGQTIGLLGNTGRSTGPHLHFQVMKRNEPVDPLSYIQSSQDGR
ncbi:hypothetical protein DCC85_04855 [Paenibacillus sp. CAA11]|uniref:M23 family metallopeptidase n=1 Tax=Paenibacillus sp. CAA11 TaxID=1532905 RepID=UPI000D38F06C|nr:M23 family metallopeptidase [Paenibacillus sp. CAA11]AWB43619.1 hypothetical protein DCC85_04855 [Paenibacillus sp. CAA11]